VLKAGGVGKDPGVVDAGDTRAFIKAAKTRQWAREPKLRTLA
jgi:catalase